MGKIKEEVKTTDRVKVGLIRTPKEEPAPEQRSVKPTPGQEPPKPGADKAN